MGWATPTLMTLILSTVGCEAERYRIVVEPEGAISGVQIRADRAELEVSTGPRLRLEMTVLAIEGALDDTNRIDIGDDGARVMVVETACASFLSCEVAMRLTVPQGLKLDIDVGEGEIWITDVDDISLDLEKGIVDVVTGGPAQIEVDRGQVMAELSEVTAAQIAVGDGNIDVKVPIGQWDIQAIADEVSVDPAVGHVVESNASIQLVAPTGRVRVRGDRE